LGRSLWPRAASSREEYNVKIDGPRADLLEAALDRVGGATTPVGTRATPGSAPVAADRVELSGDAQLLQTALQVAKQTPDIRQDVVERMRAALDRGEIGNDPDRVADALIDHWTTTTSPNR
jgi:flagellar biosynthesis anti-sigma factor FlgM